MCPKLFSDNKILSKMDKNPATTSAIAEKVGCSVITISRRLPQLEEDGLVDRIVIRGSHNKKINGWYTELNRKSRGKR